MQILMSADTVGGVWTYAVDLIHALGRHGCRVVLATMGCPLSAVQRRQVARLRNAQIYESRYKLCWMEDPWRDVEAAGEWLQDLAGRLQPDVIHLNDYPHAWLTWRAPVLVAGHSCVLSWHQQVHRQPAGEEWSRYRQEVRRGLQEADLVVAPTRAMLGWLADFYGPLRRSRVILNGRDPRRFAAGDKWPLILTAGRLWDEAKNISLLTRVAPHVHWPICVAGDQRHPDDASSAGAARHEGADWKHVRTLGPLDPAALARWYRKATIYVLPARYELFGLTAVEAALSGCALVLSDIPTLREVWGDTACFVPPDDEHAIARALNRLIRHPWEIAALANAARQRAKQLTPHRMAREYLRAYQQLLSMRRQVEEGKSIVREISERNGASHRFRIGRNTGG
jgi:glycogen synthase